jgi:hypothetical protein
MVIPDILNLSPTGTTFDTSAYFATPTTFDSGTTFDAADPTLATGSFDGSSLNF